MTTKAKVFLIITSVIVAFAVAAMVFFTVTMTDALFGNSSGDAGEAIGKVVSLILFIPLWIIVSAAAGVPSIILSIVTVKQTKWGIIHLVLSILCAAAPWIFVFIASRL